MYITLCVISTPKFEKVYSKRYLHPDVYGLNHYVIPQMLPGWGSSNSFHMVVILGMWDVLGEALHIRANFHKCDTHSGMLSGLRKKREISYVIIRRV